MRLSQLALTILAFIEELRTTAYQDQGGTWTCGYGHTGPDVREGTTCTPATALSWLGGDVLHEEDVVNKHITTTITQRQFDALVLFAYNVGEGNFGSSTLLALTNSGQVQAAALEFQKWDHVGNAVNNGLLRRDTVEAALYLDGTS